MPKYVHTVKVKQATSCERCSDIIIPSDSYYTNNIVSICNRCYRLNESVYESEILPQAEDKINHPTHYKSHPSGIECIEVVRHMSFNLGNAIKYIWRADLKNDPISDLHKAIWYIQDELNRRKKESEKDDTGRTKESK